MMKSRLTIAITCLGLGLASHGLAGDAAKGKGYYATCAACHGQAGEGMQALGAPKLAGQSPWYLVTQLKNFKAGIRGSHPDDTWGRTMMPMAGVLPDDQAIEDVVAYIGTL